jgi:hypothetical protein
MPATSSLDELISRKAAEFADQIRAAAAMADKEEEIRIEAERQLAFIERETGVKLEGKHEFTVASGRVDSVYDRVIIEYKNPSSPGARIGPKADSPGSRKVVEQIKKRFNDMRTQFNQPLNSLLGVGLDGNHFIFVRFRDEKWQVQEPVEVNRHSAERFLWALFNLGTKGKPFSPEYLAGDFGSDAKLAQDGIRALYEAISTTNNVKAQTFFSQWKILFGEVCGYDVDNPSDKIKKLAEFYGVEHRRGLKAAELLFAVHSYYALFMKLLASEIVAFFHKLPTPLQKMMQAGTGNKLRREMEDLEAGSIFRHLNITNFLEGDLFAWYTFVWGDEIERLVRAMVARLDEYNPGTLSEDPAGSRDLLKKLYQQLFPKSVRHDLGEYYTPDWLAEHVLNELEYAGDPGKRLLDPSCGSGTFLVMAINRIRAWYEENRERAAFDEGELGRKILSNIIGFDLNPLAVMAARTNYLIAIRDLIGHMDKVELPVYLCDSVMIPSEHGGLFVGTLDKTKELRTAAAKFVIPTEIATRREDVAAYAEQLEFCVRNGCSPEELLERCRDEGLTITDEALHKELYETLLDLDKASKNGIWARIIKNAFAPLYVGQVDYVAGNPPWINWENLPQSYREQTTKVWDRYGLRASTGGKTSIGKSKHELAALFLYVTADNYLPEGGKLGFVITQSVFKNQGGGGFRAFQFNGTYLTPIAVTDMVACTVFEGAVNRTATIVVTKGATKFKYPVPYVGWFTPRGYQIPEDMSLDEVKSVVSTLNMQAFPSDPLWEGSPWLTCPSSISTAIKRVIGRAYYRAYEGVNSGGLVGAYWVRKQRKVNDKLWLIDNLADAGKIKVPHVTHSVETDLLYPYIRGRDVKRWQALESCFYLLTHDPETRRCISEAEMRRQYPHAYEYLSNFKALLLARKTAPIRQQMNGGPFYPVLGIGPYTVAKWKVVFKDLTELFQCSVVGPQDSSMPGKPIIPDYTLRLIPAESELEAYYIAGLLNSSPSLAALYYSSTGVQTQRYHAGDAEKLAIVQYADSAKHREIATLSKRCHKAAKEDRFSELLGLEAALDERAAAYWGMSDKELRNIQEVLAPIKDSTNPYRNSDIDGEET